MMETEIAGSSSLEESLSVNPSPTTASNTFSAVCLYVVIAEHCRRLQTPFCAEDGMAYYGTYRGSVVNTPAASHCSRCYRRRYLGAAIGRHPADRQLGDDRGRHTVEPRCGWGAWPERSAVAPVVGRLPE